MTKLILDTQVVGAQTPKTAHIMLLVGAALLPGTAASAYFISPIVLINIIVAIIAALLLEMGAVCLRRANGFATVQDGSISLAAFLLALAVPPALPFWQLIVGVFIMVMLGKHVYGGLGHNPFNPAMVGYAALMVSFPQNMTLWFAPGELHNIGTLALIEAKLSISHTLSSSQGLWDGITQATPLEHVRSQRLQSLSVNANDLREQFMQSGSLWINLAFFIGGVFLLVKKIIQWYIPVSVIGSFLILSLLLTNHSMPIHYSLLSGALILGAFFIATDPVTTASSKRGRIIFGIGVGTLTFVIREYGGYPEGIAFAVLLMNLSAPLIDHLDIRIG